jgi:hypothetical protein
VEDQPVAGVFLDEFARREVVLEIDDHAGSIRVPGPTGSANGLARISSRVIYDFGRGAMRPMDRRPGPP